MKNITEKVFTVIIVSLLIISLSVSLNVYKINKDLANNSMDGIINGTDGLEDMFEDEEVKPDINEEENKGEGESNQDVPLAPEEEVEKPQIKPYTNGFKCYLDAIQKMEQTKGYKFVATTSSRATVLGVTETQYIKETFIKSGNYYFREQIGYCTSSLGEFFYKYWYSDDGGQTIHYMATNKITSNSLDALPDWSGKTDDKILHGDEVYKYDPYAFMFLRIYPSKESEIQGSFDPTMDPKYYVVKFKIDLKTVEDKYVNYIKNEGKLTECSLNAIERTFYIDKQTLFIRKVDKVDDCKIVRGSMLKGNTVNTAQQIVVGVDKEYVVTDPYK